MCFQNKTSPESNKLTKCPIIAPIAQGTGQTYKLSIHHNKTARIRNLTEGCTEGILT